jgi:hypothetical protein
MKKYFSLILLTICMIIANNLFASIDSTQSVVVFKDSRLDALDKRPEAMQLLADNAAKKTEVVEKDNTPILTEIHAGKKLVTGSILQKQGFRVQIYNGTDKVLAMKVKTEFTKAFPGMRSYYNYSVPNYKIKAGDFENKKDATAFLNRIKTIIPGAFIVPDVVTVKNIIVK